LFNLLDYLGAFGRIEGWFSFDAAVLFAAYQQVTSADCPPGDTLEIGVHHGLSAIAIAALRGTTHSFVAVDLFEGLQAQNESRSGDGNRKIFEQNLRTFYQDRAFLKTIACGSSEIQPSQLGDNFTFCHIDGGHSRSETFQDLQLCSRIVRPGGLIAIDDYFNPLFPGVAEGAIEFLVRSPGVIRPLAIGYNKVLFQRVGGVEATNARLRERYPMLNFQEVRMWDEPVLLFSEPIRKHFDLARSTMGDLVVLPLFGTRARIQVAESALTMRPGSHHIVSVSIENISEAPFPSGERVFGVSYHILAPHGATLVHDNDREWITKTIEPGQRITRNLTVVAPVTPGSYIVEVDLVWEGVLWFRDAGSPTAHVTLNVAG